MSARVIKIEIPIETQDKTDPALGNVKTKLEDLDSAAEKAKKSMTGFEKSLGSTEKKVSGFEKLFGRKEWKVLLEAKDKITPTVKQVLILMKSLSGKAWKVTLKAVDLVTSPVRRVYGLLKSPLVAAGVTISAGAGIASTVKTYADFESAMSQVKAISGATGEEFTQLTEKAKQMGAVTKFTASESAEAFTYMAQAGWSAREMMDGIEGLMSLAAASGESLGATSDIVTDDLYWYYLKGSKPECSMALGWEQIGGKWYYFNLDKNCQAIGSMMRCHWITENGKRYYLKEDGVMAANEIVVIDGKEYRFDGSGALIM